MTYREKEARELVIQAGHRLAESGLVAHTWGDISARISSTHFVIAPSGCAYDTLTPDQLVRVRIDDCSCEGSIKPSVERGIHAVAYLHRPDAGFVIHTHQAYASCIGISGMDLTEYTHPALGSFIPCASYGMPSTKKLCRNVNEILIKHPTVNTILMRSHGALCMARDLDRAFELLQALEDISREAFERTVTLPETLQTDAKQLLNALRSSAAGQHFAVETHSAVQAVAVHGKTLRPHLDDLAQIAGATIRCAKNDPDAVWKALKGRNAVLVPGIGAVCCATEESSLSAIAAIVRKGCMAALYAAECGAPPLHALDRRWMRLAYTTKYSRQKTED